MGKLGTTKGPLVARVRTEKRAVEIIDLCYEHNIKAIVGIEPDQAEDIRDVAMAISRRLKVGLADANTGRAEPFPSGSDKYSNAPVPKRRVDFSSLPPKLQMCFSEPQYVAFADAEFTVDFADIRNTVGGGEGSGNMADNVELTEEGSHHILLHLSEPRDSQVAPRGARARKRYSFSVTINHQPPIHVERGDTVHLIFAAGFSERDAPDSPQYPWQPIFLANCATGQHVTFGTAPTITYGPLFTMLKVAIGLMLVAGIGLAAYAAHLQHRFSFLLSAVGCIALAYLLKRILKQTEGWSKSELQRIAQLARDYPV
jgi:hypothetical protein